jgi:kumamolisin
MNRKRVRTSIFCAATLLTLSFGLSPSSSPAQTRIVRDTIRLYGYVPERALARAEWKGRMAAGSDLSMTFALPLRNPEELSVLLSRIYDPADPLYGRYLTSQEFTERFGPTQSDYDAVAGYAQGMGFAITGRHSNRLLLDVSAPAGAVETGFNVRMHRYAAPGGREFHAPDDNPEVPEFIASRIAGVIGLENANVRRPYSRYRSADQAQTSPRLATGPGGGLSPQDIARAYNLHSVAANGSGETLAIFGLDGYYPSDIAAYVSYFGLRSVPLENVYVDGYQGRPGSGASETTLDIELQIALAPGASRILVYQGQNSNTGVLHTYNRIATDNLARQVSTSWGLSELESSRSVLDAENAIFQQMAAQGQTIYAAAGDSGAYDNGSSLSVDDPSSQPYVVATGGTRLYLARDSNDYDHETTWNTNNTVRGGAGGGGTSAFWSIPGWQQQFVPAESLASGTMRNVPDISLNADPETGYSIYYRQRWYVYGGTSCAAPLWAAYTARINQQRIANGLAPLGFASPLLYQMAGSLRYAADFHDIADGTSNLYYRAGSGYDNATGLGSFNGYNLLQDLAPSQENSSSGQITYYNSSGEPYTNEAVAYWQTSDGLWWRGDLSGTITRVSAPPWLTAAAGNPYIAGR